MVEPTIEQIIEEMDGVSIFRYGNKWYAFEDNNDKEEGEGHTPFVAIRALYGQWKKR